MDELLKEVMQRDERSNRVRKASTKDRPDDRVKLSRQERANQCKTFQLGFYSLGAEGAFYWQQISCGEWDYCEDCRNYEGGKRRKNVKHNTNKIKHNNPDSKTRIRIGIAEGKEADSFQKRVNRHGGTCYSVPGEKEGTRDIIIEMEDDSKRTAEQMNDIYGNEVDLDNYDFEDRLCKIKQSGSKRMAGKLGQVSAIGPKRENTERVKLPKFRVPVEDNKRAREISKEILPTYQVKTFEQYQDAIYDLAERFAARLDEENIIYDIKCDFKNIVFEEVMNSYNLLVPLDVWITSPSKEKEDVSRTLDADQLAFLAAQDAHYDEQLAIMNG